MRGRMRKTFSIILACMLFSSPLMAQTSLKEAEQQLKEKNESIKNIQKHINENKQEEATVASEIQQIDQNITQIEEKIEDLMSKIEEKENQIQVKEQELQMAQQEEEEQYGTLKKRIKFMYEEGNVGYLEVLLRADSFTDFLNRMDYIKQIMEFDQAVLEEMKTTKNKIAELKKGLEDERSQLSSLQSETMVQKNAMEETKEKKGAALQTIRVDIQKSQQALEDERKASEAVEALIKKLKTSMKYTGGKLEWPVPGRYYISSPYGYRTHPISGKKMDFHTGTDIPAPTGTKIIAAADGVVIQSAYIRGYGYTVVINHGNENGKNISTLYAHNSKLLVKEGQQVKRGQAISNAGSTGNSTGPHLHFEVRIDGKHTNPMSYVTSK